jgi:sirohydrochlorin ferrochelatase
MRSARLVNNAAIPGSPPTLILAAHGSADPRSATVAHALAGRIRRLRPWLNVRTAFLDHCQPNLSDVLTDVAARGDSAVVVPMLLASAYHARVDIPAMIEASGAAVLQADVLGEDPALLTVLGQRLAEHGVSPDDHGLGVIVVAVGSSSDAANARTARVAPALRSGTTWAGVEVAFATAPRAELADAAARLRDRGARRVVVAPWFLAHGRLTDRVATSVATAGCSMTAPLGSHNLIAATLLDRFDDSQAADIAA